MFDIVSWGLAAGFILKPVVEELAKEATKDWIKDMFKGSLSNVIKLPQQEPLEKAVKKAIGKFLEEFTEQLQDTGLNDREVKEYIQPLERFLKLKQLREILGRPFQEDVKGIDIEEMLPKLWQTYHCQLKDLPNDFDWSQLSKRYVRKVKAIIREDEELRKILDSQNLEEIADNTTKIAENTQNLTGIIPDFNLERYQESIIESYRYLRLSKLDSTYQSVSYQVKLWQIFIPQTVKEALPPSRFDLSKEVLEKLRAEKDIEESFFDNDVKQYQQSFLEKPSQSVLNIVKGEKYP